MSLARTQTANGGRPEAERVGETKATHTEKHQLNTNLRAGGGESSKPGEPTESRSRTCGPGQGEGGPAPQRVASFCLPGTGPPFTIM